MESGFVGQRAGNHVLALRTEDWGQNTTKPCIHHNHSTLPEISDIPASDRLPVSNSESQTPSDWTLVIRFAD